MTLRSLIAAVCVAGACAAPVVVRAAEPAANFPSKPIRWVIPFAAGGATDVIARMVAQKMTENWGQPVIIDNKPGGTGIVGSEAVKQAAPDGYTILMATASTHSVSPAVRPKLPYGLSDFAPVTLVATFPNMLVVYPSVPARTVPEFIALLKGNPGKYNFSSTGAGGSVHLAAELFQQMTGTKMVHIPYKGSAPALNDLLSGQVQCAFDNMTAVWPLVQSGSLRALGVASTQRVKAAPDVPAIAEFVPGFEATTWVGILAPAGTPADIADKYATEVKRIVSAPEVAKRLEDLGAASAANRPAEFASFIKADIEKWRRVVAAAGISVED
jgi:tripartite-type tricarboxylate transporter receptor subunit TctC